MIRVCPKCGIDVDESHKFCPNCGEKILGVTEENSGNDSEPNEGESVADSEQVSGDGQEESESESVQEDMNTTETLAPKKKISKKTLIIIAVIAVVCIVGIILFANYAIQQRQIAEYEAYKATYIENLNSFKTIVLLGAVDSETQCNLTMKVWYNAIYKEGDSETNKYTKGAKDFNEALANLYADKKTKERVSGIESNQATVEKIMEQLQSPPEEYKDYYDLAVDLYGKYKSFTNLAVSPTGSYDSFSADVKKMDTELLELYNKLDTMVPKADMDTDSDEEV